ncbi:hypothetical protein MTR67_027063 [Solanum verrucosum]|uniref:Uncharacterized protein n=1 Tax=Solanum verrucosum TaxID=315347 RepID=A0AAF0R426_SOLVR|nr:hypothetical protein MTR67_027063 [Solanum verrucosum]
MGDLKISSKAEKNLGGWALFGSKYKDAADLFDKDGNYFKLAKSFLESQFTLCLQLDSKHEAANAARYYKKSNIKACRQFTGLQGKSLESGYVASADCTTKYSVKERKWLRYY